jgi:hypothetical protein
LWSVVKKRKSWEIVCVRATICGETIGSLIGGTKTLVFCYLEHCRRGNISTFDNVRISSILS